MDSSVEHVVGPSKSPEEATATIDENVLTSHPAADSPESSNSTDSSSSSDEEIVDVAFLYRLMTSGASPRRIFIQVLDLPDNDATLQQLSRYSDGEIWRLLFETVSRRQKLRQYNTLQDAVDLIRKSSKIIVLTGAGISVSCGIPDFRSPNGIYKRLKEEYPELRDPTHMFNIGFFKTNPQPFFSFAKELYPGKFKPSVTHHFLKLLEDRGKLLRNYSQNIDTLEDAAGVKNVVLCHGSFAQATCLTCGHKVTADHIRADIMEGRIPKCAQCQPAQPLSVYKPDVVFFGEDLSPAYYAAVEKDVEECDLLIVIGTTMTVNPVCSIPRKVSSVPQIIINREPVTHHAFDIELLGDADMITQQLASLLEWKDVVAPTFRPLREVSQEEARLAYWKSRNPDPVTPEDFDVVALREMYETRNLGAWLPDTKDVYMFVPPARYIFPGATVLEVDRDPRAKGFRGNRNVMDAVFAHGSSSSSSSDDDDDDVEIETLPATPTASSLPSEPSTSK